MCLYHPQANASLPAHIMLHGGGWRMGSINTLVCDAYARHRAVEAACVAFTVEYRLAPEHRFPAALEDAVATVRWVLEHAGDLGIDPRCVTVGGTSAGGNLAAALPLHSPELPIAALVLNVAALDLPDRGNGRTRRNAIEPDGGGRALPSAMSRCHCWSRRCLLLTSVAFHPRSALTAEHDALADGGALFAQKLRSSGVETHYTCYAGATHTSGVMTKTWATARRRAGRHRGIHERHPFPRRLFHRSGSD